MFTNFIKSLSILKKFLFINLIIFLVIGSLAFLYISNVKPILIKNKTTKHIKIINNTIEHILRLNIKFEEEDIRRFLFSTRFLFQNLDRVILFDNQFNLVGDTDTLDLDPRSFSNRLDIVQLETLNEEKSNKIVETKNINKEKTISLKDILTNYSWSKDYGKPYTFVQEGYDQFLLTTINNVILDGKNIGYLVITENANDVKLAIDERKTFILRTVIFIVIVIVIFSFVLNRYFLKPITFGGEHSITPGCIAPFVKKYKDICLLHFDAHADLRESYNGEKFSHASAIRRCLDYKNVSLISFGIRNISESEIPFLKKNSSRIDIFWAKDKAKWDLKKFKKLIKNKTVYLTFDVDGLDSSIMPATGTPEPGGLLWDETLNIIRIAAKNSNIVGADINELSPIKGFNSYNFLVAKLAYKILSYKFFY
ncbi:arginase family protein [Candidatus Pelagibacter sp.]|nr:arginase family protein [Candidatus Pelagibacter sp.]